MIEDSIILLRAIFLPIIVGIFIKLLIPKKFKMFIGIVSIITTLIVFILNFNIFIRNDVSYTQQWLGFGINFSLHSYPLSKFCLLFVGLFSLLIALYSYKFIWNNERFKDYYVLLLITFGVSNGVLLSNNFIVLIIFWEIALLMLYGLVRTGTTKESYISATKTLFTVGFADFCLVLGAVLYWKLTNSWEFGQPKIIISSKLAVISFILIAVGALAKSGAIPFHTWIPEISKDAPVSVMAYLPASLDKLLGIYLLAKLVHELFDIGFSLSLVLMVIGAITIIVAVMMAMIQHDLRKLLSYHAISQVGYMVLGIGTGNPVGIAGGLFHMLNHAIYKNCLFLCGGNVIHKTGESDLDKLGGLSKYLPLTFISCLIASFSISGVPPFNGFVSKWMIYQGVIQKITDSLNINPITSFVFILCLISAMFGSALTLASFMKLIHAIFLGAENSDLKNEIKVNWSMKFAPVLLGLLCIIFGIFAFQVPIKYFIIPTVDISNLIGFWEPGFATILIIIGLVLGLIIYLLGSSIKVRVDNTYIGGEVLPAELRVTGTDFYQTIRDMKPFSSLYNWAEQKIFDTYEWGLGIANSLSKFGYICLDRLVEKLYIFINKLGSVITNYTTELQGGLLSVYLYWSLFGLFLLILILCKF